MNEIDVANDAADRLRDDRKFAQAAEAYRKAVQLAPSRADLFGQLGNMLKDSGDLRGAIAAYGQAIALKPGEADTYFQLGRAHLLDGDRVAGIKAFSRALQLAPTNIDIINEMVALGQSWDAGRSEDIGDRLLTSVLQLADELRRGLREVEAHLPLISTLVRVPFDRHDAWRQTRKTPPPPRPAEGFTVAAIFQGDAPLPDVLAVLASLQAQAQGGCVFAMPDLEGDRRDAFLRLAHARPERYLRFDAPAMSLSEMVSQLAQHDAVLIARTPMVLDPQLLAWAASTLAEGADAVIPDEDVVHREGEVLRFETPRLAGACDLEWLEQGFEPGSVIIARTNPLVQALTEAGDPPDPAQLVLALARNGAVRPLPEVFASRPAGTPTPLAPAVNLRTIPQDDASFAVIIPTRDRAALLTSCLDALERKARNRGRLQIVIIDNASSEPDAIGFLTDGAAAGRFSVLKAHEPFNWSRFNRLGVAASRSTHLLFLNNDVEMITEGWDDITASLLARREIGVVGAKLLYPNGTIQHAGMYIKSPGTFEHAGRGAPAEAPGPMGLHQRRHSVTAVTGAFFALRREVFDRLGGFDDEGLPLWFNDVDFCLKAGAAGLRVVYEPALTAWHHESLSTHTAFTDATRQAHFEAARTLLRNRWGASLIRDGWMRI